MDKCCTLHQSAPRNQRRLNGFQLPLNYLQPIGWLVFFTTALLNFVILIQIQFEELKMATLIVFVVLYVSHVVSHVAASLIDPSESELRKLPVNNVPEFDRSIHAHVIENGRCHLCNIYTSSKKTKHCSLCNKCVDRFDHHCKWLNNCVGRKNYAAFIASVITALLLSALTFGLCLTDIILFFKNTHYLSMPAQDFINCTFMSDVSSNNCRTSIAFLIFLIILGVSALAIACPLLHLCCFHVYISILGVSTYEYMVNGDISDALRPCCMSRCGYTKLRCTNNIYRISKPKDENKSQENCQKEGIDKMTVTETDIAKPNQRNSRNVATLITILINNEFERASRIFFDKNRIHPQDSESSTEIS